MTPNCKENKMMWHHVLIHTLPDESCTALETVKAMAGTLTITTAMGVIRLALRPDAAPVTTAYIKKCVDARLYDGTSFYRR